MMKNVIILFLVSICLISIGEVASTENNYLLGTNNIETHINFIDMNMNGNYIAVASDNGIYVFNRSGDLIWKDVDVSEINMVYITSDSRYVGSSKDGVSKDYYILSDGRRLTFNKDYFFHTRRGLEKKYNLPNDITITLHNRLIEIDGKSYIEPEWWNYSVDSGIYSRINIKNVIMPIDHNFIYDMHKASDFFDYKDYSRDYYMRNIFNINRIPNYGFTNLILPFPDNFTVIGDRDSIQLITTPDVEVAIEATQRTFFTSSRITKYKPTDYNTSKTIFSIWPFGNYFERTSRIEYKLEYSPLIYRFYYIKGKIIAVTHSGFDCFDLNGNRMYFERVSLTPSVYSNNLNYLAVGREDYLYVLNDEKVLFDFKTEGNITSVYIHPRDIVVCGTEYGNLYIFDLNKPQTKEIQTIDNNQIQEEETIIQEEEITQPLQPVEETKNVPGFGFMAIFGGSLLATYLINRKRK